MSEKIKPSTEQEHILSLAEAGKSIVGIARAGAAKTTTARWAIQNRSHTLRAGKKILVWAFNSQVESDMQANINKNGLTQSVDVFTFHRFARRKIGHQYQQSRFSNRWPSGKDISQALSIDRAYYPWGNPISVGYTVLETIQKFCLSADTEISYKHIPLPDGAAIDTASFEAVRNYARKAWLKMGPQGDLPVTHDVYLKAFALSCPDIAKDYDMVVLEEGQDINPVIIGMVESFAKHIQVLVFGDPLQQIYDWRDAEDALTYFADKAEFTEVQLTTSYRFGEAIAQATKDMVKAQLGKTIVLNGANSGDKIGPFHPALQRTIITRTNSEILLELHKCAENGIPAKAQKDMTELLNLINAAEAIKSGHPVVDGPLSKFKTWEDLELHAMSKTGQEFQGLLNMHKRFNGFDIPRKIIEKSNATEDNIALRARIGTAHTFKGSEFPFVQLGGGFIDKASDNKRWTPEEARILYVAMTRAKKGMDISTVSSFLQSKSNHLPKSGV